VIFTETPIPDAFEIELERVSDERGWFARTFDSEEFSKRGLEPAVIQANTSFNERAGTLRGMHLQADPDGEPKLVRCTRGAIFDVIVDLREGSAAHRRWHGVELSAENGLMLYIPTGVAHGFQTLTDGAEVGYLMGHRYVPDAARGVRWDDPAFGIEWPPVDGERVISDKDRAYPLVDA
jgi:dTDP-4-dehydrorhamnose 3,5-epimerase